MNFREYKERVKAATDLKALIEEYTPLTKVSNNLWSGRCPHPDHEDKNPSFRLFLNSSGEYSWKCFGCQDVYAKKGEPGYWPTDCFAFIQWISNHKGSEHILTFPESVRYLGERAEIDPPQGNIEIENLLKENEKFARMAHDNLFPAVEQYLYDRGLTDHDIELWLLGAYKFVEEDKTVLRLVMPLFNRTGRIIGFSNRSLEDDDDIAKYKNSHNSIVFQKRNYLYGCNRVTKNFKELRIVEGQFDVILGYKAGIKNIVATLGSSITEEQVSFIRQEGFTPTFIYDGDVAGQKGMERAVQLCMAQQLSSKVCALAPGKDLADMAPEISETWVQQHSIPGWRYLLQETAVRYEAEVQALRKKIIPDILAAVPQQGEDRVLMKSFVKERFGITL